MGIVNDETLYPDFGVTKNSVFYMENPIIKILKAEMKKTGLVEIKLEGRCMSPLFSDGDTAWIIPAEKYEKGNLCLACLSDGRLAFHRIVDIDKIGYILKGDRSRKAECVDEKNIIGIAQTVQINGFVLNLSEKNLLPKLQALLSKATILYEINHINGYEREYKRTVTGEICEKLLFAINNRLCARKRNDHP